MHKQRNEYEIKRVKQVFDTRNALAVVACPKNIYDKYDILQNFGCMVFWRLFKYEYVWNLACYDN